MRNSLWRIFRFIKYPAYRLWLRENKGLPSKFFPQWNVDDLLATIRGKGVVVGPELSDAVVKGIFNFAQSAQCCADRNVEHSFNLADYNLICDKLGKNVLVAQYMNVADQLPIIKELSKDTFLLNVAAEYLQTPPKLVGINHGGPFQLKRVMKR